MRKISKFPNPKPGFKYLRRKNHCILNQISPHVSLFFPYPLFSESLCSFCKTAAITINTLQALEAQRGPIVCPVCIVLKWLSSSLNILLFSDHLPVEMYPGSMGSQMDVMGRQCGYAARTLSSNAAELNSILIPLMVWFWASIIKYAW